MKSINVSKFAKNSAKTIVAIAIMTIMILVGVFASGCKKSPESITIVAPDGAPALAVARLIEEKKIDNTTVNVKIVAASDIATESLKADFAVVPSNVAPNLYNKKADIKVLDVVTNGNLYILSSVNNDITLAGLAGKQIFSIGQGSVPDLIFQSILKQNDIAVNFGDTIVDGKVSIAYSADGSEVIAKLMKAKKGGVEVYGLLGEPAVSMAMSKGLFQKFDLQQLWMTQTQSQTMGYPQAVLIASGNILKNTKMVAKVRALFADNSTWLQSNSDKAVA
ncbi:MAG: hypothetical protein RR348_06440, partial [Clostridia bacterium]